MTLFGVEYQANILASLQDLVDSLLHFFFCLAPHNDVVYIWNNTVHVAEHLVRHPLKFITSCCYSVWYFIRMVLYFILFEDIGIYIFRME